MGDRSYAAGGRQRAENWDKTPVDKSKIWREEKVSEAEAARGPPERFSLVLL